jgi:hypothetical protein
LYFGGFSAIFSLIKVSEELEIVHVQWGRSGKIFQWHEIARDMTSKKEMLKIILL